MTPLWPLQESLYERLTSLITAAAVYDFLPDEVTYPYLLMEAESVTGVQDKSGAMQSVTAELLIFSRRRDSKELKEVYDELMVAMATPLVVTGWIVVNQVLVPNTRTYRAKTLDNQQGRAADVNFDFLFQKQI